MYKVVRAFRDAKNEDHYYGVGDTYPVSGYKPTKARIEELEKGKNKYNKVYIEKVEEDENSEDTSEQTEGTETSAQTPGGSEE